MLSARYSPTTKFHVSARAATTVVMVGYAVSILYVCSLLFGLGYAFGALVWTTPTFPPSDIAVYSGLSPHDQDQTKRFGTIYFTLGFDCMVSLATALLVLLTCSEIRSNVMFALLYIYLAVLCVAKIVHVVYLWNSKIDCSNYWYCYLNNQGPNTPPVPSKEFLYIFHQAWAVLAMLVGTLVWARFAQEIVKKVRMEEDYITPMTWHP
jgi:hypothetical protein